ncbi:MAG: chloride channel protein [bacterium]
MTGDLGHGERQSTLPVAPSIAPAIEEAEQSGVRAPIDVDRVTHRIIVISALAIGIAILAGLVAQLLMALIGLVTNAAFYSRLSTAFAAPGEAHRGPLALLLIPVAGALVVGVMARYGSAAIRGHGIPEVMERVLFGESRIPARVMFLKPLSAAIAIGTGGPFGAEGPIIATGGALGSLAGQMLHVTIDERKTLLAAGAAAGMAATFGSPVSAILLAVELLLFEYRPRSLVPVSLAAAVATGVRIAFVGFSPVFPIPVLVQPGGGALAFYTVLGALIGVVAVGITRLTYGIEDVFEIVGKKLRLHWMWWPAIGALVVGAVGIIEPRTLGVGYDNITAALSGSIVGRALIMLVVLKLVSWSVYLGSGTSGGTLAPLFTIGGGLGALLGTATADVLPGLGIQPAVAGLVGMAAIFAGASHALLTSVVFAFETTRQPIGLLPLLGGCSAAYLTSLLLSPHSIMTEKLARRGANVSAEYASDYLTHVLARDAASRPVVTLSATDTIEHMRERLRAGGRALTHQGFPVLDAEGLLVGVVMRRDLLDPARSPEQTVADAIMRTPVVAYADNTLRDAADHMVLEQVGRLPVVTRDNPRLVIGMLSRSDLLAAHAPRLRAASMRVRPRWASEVRED